MQKNRIEIAGYLTDRPSMRYLPSGTKVANVRLGESYRFKDQEGNQQTHTNWHSLVFYNDIAEAAVTFQKGQNIFVEGSMQQRKFTPTDGVTRTVHEIHVQSCHIIASSRASKDAVPADGEDLAAPSVEGADHDPSWPVGPA